jgi:hypothetical protein
MDDWLGNLPGELAYDVIAALLLYSAGRAWQNRKRLEGYYGKDFRVTLADRVGVSDAVQTLTGGGVATPRGMSSASGVLSVSFPKKRSPAEELFWWYWRIRLS